MTGIQNFFKNDTPERLAKVEGEIKLIRKEIENALIKQRQQFDAEIEEMETALLARIADAEKTVRSNSLKSDGKSKDEAEQVGGGYVTWSQRKAKRISTSADKGFAEKVLRKSQRGSTSAVKASS